MDKRKLNEAFNKRDQEIAAGKLIGAAARGDNAAVQRFLDANPGKVDALTHYNEQGYAFYVEKTALIAAAEGGHKDTVELLLKNGADINKVTPIGFTAISEAIRAGQTEVVRTLLDKGAAVEGNNPHGWTPLMNAVWHFQAETVKLLLERGASVDKEFQGRTPLKYIQETNAQLAADKHIPEEERTKALVTGRQIEALLEAARNKPPYPKAANNNKKFKL